MLTFVLIIAVIISILLMLVVLIQNPKGGGIASNFSAGNQFFGVAKTTNIVEKLTWGFAIAIIVISLYASSFNTYQADGTEVIEGNTDVEQLLNDQPDVNIPDAAPTAPTDAGAEDAGSTELTTEDD